MIVSAAQGRIDIENMVYEASGAGSSVIVFPEMACRKDIPMFQELAFHHNIFICASYSDRGSAATLVDNYGKVVGSYRKKAITYRDRERKGYVAGEPQYFDCDLGRVGILICFDLFFPELCESLSRHNIDILLYPLMNDYRGTDMWTAVTRTRAYDGGFNIIAAVNSRPGTSMIVDRYGTVLAKAETLSTVVSAELNLDDIPMCHYQGFEKPWKDVLNDVRQEFS